MTLEKFVKQQIPDWPSLTIRKNGSLCLNSRAIEQFKLETMRFATLYYDRKEQLLGIKPEEGNRDPSVYRISKEKNRTSVISCQAFLNHYGILYKERSKVYPAEWDEKGKMILVKIG